MAKNTMLDLMQKGDSLTGEELGMLRLAIVCNAKRDSSPAEPHAWAEEQAQKMYESGSKQDIWFLDQYERIQNWLITDSFTIDRIFQQLQYQIRVLSGYGREFYITEVAVCYIKEKVEMENPIKEIPGAIMNNTLDTIIEGPLYNASRVKRITDAQKAVQEYYHRLLVYNFTLSSMARLYKVPEVKFWKVDLKNIDTQLSSIIEMYKVFSDGIETQPVYDEDLRDAKLEILQESLDAISFSGMAVPRKKQRAIRDMLRNFSLLESLESAIKFAQTIQESITEEQKNWG